MLQIIIYILKLDYSLSDWFSKTSQTVVPGTAFLFLNKLAFLLSTIYFAVLPLLPIQLGASMAIGILCGLVLVVMYGLQAEIESIVKSSSYSMEYHKVDNSRKVKDRLLGLLVFFGSFILMFIVGILSFSGYANFR